MHGTQRQPVYEFNGFRLDPRRRLVMRGDEDVVLTGKVFDALLYFVMHAGAPVSRDELMKALWPNTITEDNSLTQVVSTLRRALGDEQDGRRLIVTVPRRGYQFVGDVREVAGSDAGAVGITGVEEIPTEAGPAARPGVLSSHRAGARLVGYVLAGLALVAAAGFLLDRHEGYVPGHPAPAGLRAGEAGPVEVAVLRNSVAVLPFRNLSRNPDDAYFAAGLHEEIISQLAKIRALTVIARTSVMGYADTKRPIREIGRELRVGAVLEGSASRAGDRIRVSVQLVDASTNALFWGETYDRDVRDVFSIQADIARRVAAALETELSAAERESIGRPLTRSLEAYGHYLRALAQFREAGGIGPGMDEDQRRAMQSDLDKATAIDPGFAAAYAWKAFHYVDSLYAGAVPEQQWPAQRDEWMRLIELNIARALQFEPATAMAYVAQARLDFYRWRLAEAGVALEHARQLGSNDAPVLQQLALHRCLVGDFADAIAIARRGIEIDPKNPGTHAPLQLALQAKGEISAAAAASEGMIAASPRAAVGYVLLARTETARGNHPKVREALRFAEELAGTRGFTRVGMTQVAMYYRRIGATSEADRVLARLRQVAAGMHADAGLRAMEFLAAGEYDRALGQAHAAATARSAGTDPFLLLLIAQNVWADPVLETPPWVQVRAELGYHR